MRLLRGFNAIQRSWSCKCLVEELPLKTLKERNLEIRMNQWSAKKSEWRRQHVLKHFTYFLFTFFGLLPEHKTNKVKGSSNSQLKKSEGLEHHTIKNSSLCTRGKLSIVNVELFFFTWTGAQFNQHNYIMHPSIAVYFWDNPRDDDAWLVLHLRGSAVQPPSFCLYLRLSIVALVTPTQSLGWGRGESARARVCVRGVWQGGMSLDRNRTWRSHKKQRRSRSTSDFFPPHPPLRCAAAQRFFVFCASWSSAPSASSSSFWCCACRSWRETPDT